MASSRDPRRPDHPVDEPLRYLRQLRQLLAPRPEAVEWIVRRSLAAAPPAAADAAPRTWRVAAAAVAAVAGLVALLLARLDPSPLAPSAAPASSQPHRPAAISIVSEGDVLIATTPAGDWLVRGAEPAPPQPRLIVVTHGGTDQ
jgi:hypothetical protein